jgi:hypothetical protein
VNVILADVAARHGLGTCRHAGKEHHRGYRACDCRQASNQLHFISPLHQFGSQNGDMMG